MNNQHNTPPWDANLYPWYKRFARDFLASPRVASMSLKQRGIYSVLLDRAWAEDGIPSDPHELALSALTTPTELAEAWVWPLDSAFVLCPDGKLRHQRMEDIRTEAINLRSARSRGGSKTRLLQESPKSLGRVLQDSPKSPGGKQKEERREKIEEKKKKGASAPDALASALEDLDHLPQWVGELLATYRDHRVDLKGAKQGKLTTSGWKAKAKQFHGMGEAPARACVALSISNGWLGLFPEKVQQAASQAPSRGGYYNGPKLKDSEARRKRGDIRDRMAAQAGDFLLAEDDALAMARAQGDHEMHLYDWMTGLRNDAPPMQQAPHTLEIGHEPSF